MRIACLAILAAAGCSHRGSSPQVAPTIVVNAPLGNIVVGTGTQVVIEYIDDDANDDATTSLFAVEAAGQEIAIARDLPERNGDVQQVMWDTTGVPPGSYAIEARVSDGLEEAVAQAPGRVTVNGAPSLTFTSPAATIDVSRGLPVQVSFLADDPDDAALVSIYADQDGDLATTEDQIPIVLDAPEGAHTVAWDTAGVPADGSYRIVGVAVDGLNDPVVVVASGSVTLANVAYAQVAVTSPDFVEPRGIAAFPDDSYVVAGRFDNQATLARGEPNETTLAGAGSEVLLARYRADGALLWARSAGSPRGDFGHAVAAFPDGSSVVAGAVDFDATFGAGEPNETTLDRGVFLARYNVDGSLAWAHLAWARVSGSSVTTTAMDSYADGSFCVTGHFQGTVVLGAGEANETTLVAERTNDVFTAKYNADGTLVWAAGDAGTGIFDVGNGIAALPDGSCIVTGAIDGTSTFGRGEPGETVLVSMGSNEIFVAKYDPDGTLAWARRDGGMASDAGRKIDVLADGSCIVTGDFRDEVTFGENELNETMLVGDGTEIFLAKYNPDGTLAWVRQDGGAGPQDPWDVVVLDDGSCVVTGRFNTTAVFGAGEPNETMLVGVAKDEIFVAKYGPDGALLWVRSDGGAEREHAWAIAALSDGSVVVTGRCFGAATFGRGEPRETALADPRPFVFVARYNVDGGF